MRNHAAREIHPLRYWYTIIGMHWFLLARHWLIFLTLPRQGGSLPLFTTLSSQATLPLTHARRYKPDEKRNCSEYHDAHDTSDTHHIISCTIRCSSSCGLSPCIIRCCT